MESSYLKYDFDVFPYPSLLYWLSMPLFLSWLLPMLSAFYCQLRPLFHFALCSLLRACSMSCFIILVYFGPLADFHPVQFLFRSVLSSQYLR